MAAGPREARGDHRRGVPRRVRLLHRDRRHRRRAHAPLLVGDRHRRLHLLHPPARGPRPAVPGDQATGLTADRGRARGGEPGRPPRPPLERPVAARRSTWLSRHTPGDRRLLRPGPRRGHPHLPRALRAAGWPRRTPTPSGRFPAHLAAWLMTRPERFAVIHGDYRPDNLMFPAARRRRLRRRLADARRRPPRARRRLPARHQPRPGAAPDRGARHRRGLPPRPRRARGRARAPRSASTTTGSASCRAR